MHYERKGITMHILYDNVVLLLDNKSRTFNLFTNHVR